MSKEGREPKSGAEYAFMEQLFAYLDQPIVKKAYIDPVMDKLLNETLKGRSRGYEGNFKAFKRAVGEMARRWKLEHGPMWGLGIGKAAENRQIEQVAQAIMEVFLTKQAKYNRLQGIVKGIETDINRKLRGG